MSIFEIVCISVMTVGAFMVIAGISVHIIRNLQTHRPIEDEVSRYWREIYKAAGRAETKYLNR